MRNATTRRKSFHASVRGAVLWTMVLVAFLCVFPGTVASARPVLHVAVSIPPQAYFVKQLGGNRVTVQVLLPPGANPATFEPKARALVALAKADLYFRIHVPFENAWMDKFRSVNPGMKIVDTVRDLGGRVKTDPHVWLAPSLVKRVAKVMTAALSEVDPEGRAVYQKNLVRFRRKIDALTTEIKKCFSVTKRKTFLVYHPCWGYFAREFGLTQVAIEKDGKAPGAAYLAQIVKMAREKKIRCVFVQPQFDVRSADVIARQIQGRIVFLDPMAKNWRDNLLQSAKKIAECLEK